MKRTAILSSLACVLFVLVINTLALGAGSLTALPSGSDVLISASNLSDVNAIDITVTYDPGVLSNAQVVQQGGFHWSMFLPNTSKIGTIRLAMLNEPPLSGSGPLAKISFASTGKGATGVTISYQIISGNSSQKNVLAVTVNSGATQIPDPSTPPLSDIPEIPDSSGAATGGDIFQADTGTASGDGTYRSGTFVAPGTVTFDSPERPVTQTQERDKVSEQSVPTEEPPRTEPLETAEPGDPHASHARTEPSLPEPDTTTVPASQDEYAVHTGVAMRFRNYSGPRTPKALMSLFRDPVSDNIRQEPTICISDGKSSVRITLDLSFEEKTAPNFALKGAALKSLKKDGERRWIVEALPEAGAVEATLIIVTGERMVEYPLTVAPRVEPDMDGKGGISDADFVLYLARKSVGPPRSFDLNGDGKVDYLDDYIYTANHLVAKEEKKTRK